MVQGSWAEVQDISASQAKAEVLKTLSQWQLFGSSFFAVTQRFFIVPFTDLHSPFIGEAR